MSLVHGNILRRYPTGRAVGQLYLIHAVAFADDGDGCAVVQAADDVALSAVRCAQVEAGAAGSDGTGADGIGGVFAVVIGCSGVLLLASVVVSGGVAVCLAVRLAIWLIVVRSS